MSECTDLVRPKEGCTARSPFDVPQLRGKELTKPFCILLNLGEFFSGCHVSMLTTPSVAKWPVPGWW